MNVSIASGEGFCIEIVLRCLVAPGDGLGHRESSDGGILSGIMAAGFKGEKYYFTCRSPSVTNCYSVWSIVNMSYVLVLFEMMKSKEMWTSLSFSPSQQKKKVH